MVGTRLRCLFVLVLDLVLGLESLCQAVRPENVEDEDEIEDGHESI